MCSVSSARLKGEFAIGAVGTDRRDEDKGLGSQDVQITGIEIAYLDGWLGSVHRNPVAGRESALTDKQAAGPCSVAQCLLPSSRACLLSGLLWPILSRLGDASRCAPQCTTPCTLGATTSQARDKRRGKSHSHLLLQRPQGHTGDGAT